MINHPRQERSGGVERDFDLAKVDGMAGVREGRENTEGVIEVEGSDGADERWR